MTTENTLLSRDHDLIEIIDKFNQFELIAFFRNSLKLPDRETQCIYEKC